MFSHLPDQHEIQVRIASADAEKFDDYSVYCDEFLLSLGLDPKRPNVPQSLEYAGEAKFEIFNLEIVPHPVYALSDEWVCQFQEISGGLIGFKINEQLVAISVTEEADDDFLKKLPTELENLSFGINISNRIDLRELWHLTALKRLKFSSGDNLTDIRALSELRELSFLSFLGCECLEDINPLSALVGLTHLDFGGCRRLNDLNAISNLKKLEWLNLSGCEHVTDSTALSALSELSWLNLHGCKNLTAPCPLSKLTKLSYLDLIGCDKLLAALGKPVIGAIPSVRASN